MCLPRPFSFQHLLFREMFWYPLQFNCSEYSCFNRMLNINSCNRILSSYDSQRVKLRTSSEPPLRHLSKRRVDEVGRIIPSISPTSPWRVHGGAQTVLVRAAPNLDALTGCCCLRRRHSSRVRVLHGSSSKATGGD